MDCRYPKECAIQDAKSDTELEITPHVPQASQKAYATKKIKAAFTLTAVQYRVGRSFLVAQTFHRSPITFPETSS
jgi:hypothetical protein